MGKQKKKEVSESKRERRANEIQGKVGREGLKEKMGRGHRKEAAGKEGETGRTGEECRSRGKEL